MKESLRASLESIIDYAGLFPPAQLPLDQAVSMFISYQQVPETWMLGRFICPASRLHELKAFRALLNQAGCKPGISVLGRGGVDARVFFEGLDQDRQCCVAFEKEWGDAARLDLLETKLPESLRTTDTLAEDVAAALGRIIVSGGGERGLPNSIFLELGWTEDYEQRIPVCVKAIAEANRQGGGERNFGFKIRCGGVEASAFPDSRKIACAIIACRDQRVALKATAGLHHPEPRMDPALQARMHGFLNVFLGGALAQARHLEQEKLTALLNAQLPSITFEDKGIRWNELEMTNEEIRNARQSLMTSFGSCSFDEPREDLRALGLL